MEIEIDNFCWDALAETVEIETLDRDHVKTNWSRPLGLLLRDLYQFFLSADCDINWTTFEGETPLFIACKSLSTDVVTNPPTDDVANPQASNVTDLQTSNVTNPQTNDVTNVNKLKVIRRILKREDADVNLADNFGTTPLHLAAQAGNHLVTKWI